MSSLLKRQWQLDIASWLALVATAVLFAIALIEKGFTQEILLESGVFLISLKLVLATHQLQLELRAIEVKLDAALRERSRDENRAA